MPDLWTLLGDPSVELLGWVLLHFVWQGALLAAVLAGALYVLKDESPRTRYALNCAALAVLFLLPLATGLYLHETALSSVESGPVASPVVVSEAPEVATTSALSVGAAETSVDASLWSRVSARLRPALPWIVMAWAMGVLLFSLRLVGGAWQVRRLRQQSAPAPDEWQERLRALADRVGVGRAIGLKVSPRVDSPMVAGWWRPVVLVPAGLLVGLPPSQVEALLLHELAHIRRHDVLVGRLQAVVETLFFFHPATWWISRQVRQSREACCDDLTVQAGTDRAVYARALATLAERAVHGSQFAGAPAASDGSLVSRIRRLLSPETGATSNVRRLSIAVVVVLLIGVPALLGACASQQGTSSGADAAESAPAEDATDTTSETEVSDFLLVVGTTEEGFDLRCEEGCAWETLSFASFGEAQAFDQYGMTNASEPRDRGDSDLARFRITMERGETDRGKEQVRLACTAGCAWKTLSFGGWDEWENVWQPVDQNGMATMADLDDPQREEGETSRRWPRVPDEERGEWIKERADTGDVSPNFFFTAPDSIRRAFRMRFDPDSLAERAKAMGLRADSIERRVRRRMHPDSLERHARQFQHNADSLERVIRRKINPDSLEQVFRDRFDADSLERVFRRQFNEDSLRQQFDRVRIQADSLFRWREEHADSLRRRFESMRERWGREMPEHLREQARRLRERAERLEERAEQMEGPPPPPEEPGIPDDTSRSSDEVQDAVFGRRR